MSDPCADDDVIAVYMLKKILIFPVFFCRKTLILRPDFTQEQEVTLEVGEKEELLSLASIGRGKRAALQ